MKKILATLALLAGVLYTLSAVPAYPGRIRVSQPDGSSLLIQVHGDEWYHYVTDDQGRVVARDKTGFFRPAEKPTLAEAEEAMEMRSAAQQMRVQAARASSFAQGEHRIPVILVNFSDADGKFITQDPVTAFSNMLNQEGYSRFGGTGSVRDFYVENSHGQYTPSFAVYGPVTLSNTSEYYAGNGGTQRVAQAVVEACKLLDDEVDFSQYDSDGDGRLDMLLMYYAGHNQAEGGPTTSIWPHQSYANGFIEGKQQRFRYFCTSELSGAEGSQMCGIGTTTHEFAHSLGLPDFYDTDYETNGQAGALYSFSTMCNGSYNNNGRTPPYFNSEELRLLGWMGDQTEIEDVGELTVEPIQDYVAYRIPTTEEGEYFVLECRNKQGWDSYTYGSGLVVYHVDKSTSHMVGSMSAYNHWTSQYGINTYQSHPCFYIVPASNPSSLTFFGGESELPFPGTKKVKSYLPVDWQGENPDFRLTDIAFDGTRVTLNVKYSQTPGVMGIVRNMSAKPVRGATVSLFRTLQASPAPGIVLQRRVQGQPLKSMVTEADGTYSFEDEALLDGSYTLVVTCDGYVEAVSTVQIGRRIEECDFYLRKVDEPEESTFIKYDPEGGDFSSIGIGSTQYNLGAAFHLTAEETTPYDGKQIKLISFELAGAEGMEVDAAYVFVEAGGRRIFTQRVENLRVDAMNIVNVTGQEFTIPGGTELYIGYGLVGCNEVSPILAQVCDADHAGYFTAYFRQNSASSWSILQTQDGTCFAPVISASVGEPVAPELGFNHIANPGEGVYAAGSRFDLSLVQYEDDAPSTVSWVFDGQAVQAGSVTLTAGQHAVEAHLTYPDGSVEVLRLVIQAE